MSNIEGLEYWLKWQVAVCALIFIIPLVVALIIIKKSIQKERCSFRSTDLWIPCWRSLHPIWLLLYRLSAFLIMLYLLYQTVASGRIFAFFFYTQWTFTLVTLYLGIGSIVSARGCWIYSTNPIAQNEERDKFVKKLEDDEKEDEKQDVLGLLETCMQIVYQTCSGAVMLTDIVFWCLLVPFVINEEITFLIGCMHSVNALVLLVDSAFNSLPFSWYGLTYFVLWSCSYVIFQWVLHACCVSWWPYPFLELSTPWAPMWYLALAMIHIVCYGLYMLLVKAKNSLFSRIFPREFTRLY